MDEKKNRKKAFIFTALLHACLFLLLGNFIFSSLTESREKEKLVQIEIFGTGSQANQEIGGGGGSTAPLSTHKNLAVSKDNRKDSKQTFASSTFSDLESQATQSNSSFSEDEGGSSSSADIGGSSSGSGENGDGAGSGGGSGGGTGTGEGSGSGPGRGGGIAPPQVLSKIEPNYPDSAINQGLAGTVVVSVSINESGTVSDVSISSSSGHSALDQAVLNAVRRWRFVPAKNLGTGQAVSSRVNLPVVFNLKNRK